MSHRNHRLLKPILLHRERKDPIFRYPKRRIAKRLSPAVRIIRRAA